MMIKFNYNVALIYYRIKTSNKAKCSTADKKKTSMLLCPKSLQSHHRDLKLKARFLRLC